ncbi:MAG TPA: polyamine ABC transporter substrate-binding protein [Vicinamibacterales bacterium]|nr:polyamine ABC transporter substrate-binding protein [Vicinamibacterales bacterium]
MGAPAGRGLTLAAILLLAACGDDGSGQAGTIAPGEQEVVHVYNWTDYIGQTTIADFEAKTGIRVVYDTYDSNEIVETKLLTGKTGYDVVFPTASVLSRLARIGVFLELDRKKLPNFANLDPDILQRMATYDPGNAHAMPYMWGTTGLGYNPALVKKALGTDTLDSWTAVFDPAKASKLAGCGITMLDSPEDVFEAAEVFAGTPSNNEDPAELAAAEALVMKVRPYVRAFDSSTHLNALASGDICVALSWSGLMLQARDRGAAASQPVEVRYLIPREGAPMWFDAAAIPADAPHPDNAHAFLNFLMDPQVIAAVSNDIRYANSNAAALPFVAADMRDDPSIYPPADTRGRLHVAATRSQEYSRAVNRAWTRIKTGQ